MSVHPHSTPGGSGALDLASGIAGGQPFPSHQRRGPDVTWECAVAAHLGERSIPALPRHVAAGTALDVGGRFRPFRREGAVTGCGRGSVAGVFRHRELGH